MKNHISKSALRQRFSDALSTLYREEVPAYGTLLEIVAEVNESVDPDQAVDAARLGQERHGAIRVGTAKDLSIIARVFNQLGMEPVGYYDLSVAGLPIHSTAFRPVTTEGLEKSPFRMFTSLLRPELIDDEGLRKKAEAALSERNIFAPELLTQLEKIESNGGLDEDEAEAFILSFLKTFQWHEKAQVTWEAYKGFKEHHPLLADIVSFQGPHINHLTPRTLDIDLAQERMRERGLEAKDVIEGPPKRKCPILLRQTAFKALSEDILFEDSGEWKEGSHTARFGEIEQRGAALTPKGRELYDQCLANKDFSDFPDDWDLMREQGLAYFRKTKTGFAALTYEDFLPVSAAGIFRSNLGEDGEAHALKATANQEAFEAALGRPVHDMFALYSDQAKKNQ
ncbi:2-oxoadipate dioxygenase/decarboxylase family protein [Litorimonas haliclonae]|uniref:2-oxoadipate dioxygenase/decarboxylase family protein n=1 Tax=Litorimonas haliclonae TaxID=2081977 RepID=UPI0039F09DD5